MRIISKAKNHNKYGNTFPRIVDKENIYRAYKKSLEGDSKYTISAMVFSQDETYNIRELVWSLIKDTYTFDGYFNFKVYEPKERNIDAPIKHKDKIVQLAVTQVLDEIYNPSFIYDSYACMEDKGTHKCVNRIQYLMRQAQWEYGENAVAIKCDIKSFFASIDRDILKKILRKKIKCKKTLRLLYIIIDSADVLGPLGLPLGNSTSQNFANIYMNELDQYCKRVLGLKYYVRYMDDFFIFVDGKEEAKKILSLLNSFLEEALKLTLSETKTKYFPIKQGLNAIGFKIYTTHKLLRDDSKKRAKGKMKAMPNLVIKKGLPVIKAEQMINSWKGHADHADSLNLYKYLLEKYDFLKIEKAKVKKKKEGSIRNRNSCYVFKINTQKTYEYYDENSCIGI